MSFEDKTRNRLSQLLQSLKKATQSESGEVEVPQAKLPESDSSQHRAIRKTGIDLEPAGWPIGGKLGSLGKSSSRLSSWRSERDIQDAIAKVALYLQLQSDHYYPEAQPLAARWKDEFSGFYSPALLNRVRVAELKERRVENPWFYEGAKSGGIRNLPNMAHRTVVTFLDVIVFNEKLTARHLFHGLVHTAQVKLLGSERYAELLVTGFLQARSYFLVPLKAHAFALDTRYVEDPEAHFSVEDEVLRWAMQERY